LIDYKVVYFTPSSTFDGDITMYASKREMNGKQPS